jgi:dipeptidyl aminopeptidase/acylaminoacyl peptidase
VYGDAAHETRQFTSSAKSESHARWSPDGKKLAFLSDREEFRQIYLMSAEGGEGVRLTEGKRSIENLEWSPDGKQIAFLAPEAKTEAEEKREKDKEDAKSVDRDDKRAHLWVVETESGKSRQVVGAPWKFSELQWSPRGDRLLVIATDHPESDQETNRIFGVNPTDGSMQQIAAPRGPFHTLRISPDGGQIAYVGSRVDGPQPHDLYVLSVAGGAARNLTAQSLDRGVEAYAWRSDGKLLALVGEGFRNKFFVVDMAGRGEPLPAPEMSVSDLALSKSGTIMFAGENSTRPPELWSWDGQTAAQSISHFNQSLEQFALARPEFVRYKSFDGREIEGALLRPLGSEDKARLPTVLLIHGGPTGNWADEFDSWGQLLASAGYAVFYPNVRGSTGYGYDFMVLNRADWGGGDFKDVMAAADYLVARGVADPGRLGIAGWSYGGYMAEWAITQTQRFKAAVSGAGMADLAAEFGTEDHPSYDEWFYGLPYEKPDGFRRSSPITYIKNAHTPTLILQGEADVIDPLGQSQQLYRALKRYGVETELIVYPREGHGLKEEKHLLDRLNRVVAWFDKHLK